MKQDLNEILEFSGNTPGPEVKVALVRLSKELKMRLSNGASTSLEFFQASSHSLFQIRGMAFAELRMESLYHCGSYFYSAGYQVAALEVAKHLDYLAKRRGDKRWIRKAHNLAGLTHGDTGNVSEAFLHYGNALQICRELDDIEGEYVTLNNLGCALNYAGLYREAIPCFKRALELESQVVALGKRIGGRALSNLAQSYMYLEEFDKGFAAITQSLAGLAAPTDFDSAFAGTIREFTCVKLALELGHIVLARTHRQKCAEYGAWGRNRRLKLMADIAEGLCEIHGGDVRKGLLILESTLVRGQDTGSTRIDALTALIKAYDQVNMPTRALEYMNQFLTHVRTTREKGILTLLSLPISLGFDDNLSSNSGDLRAHQHMEAELRARVAEGEVLSARLEMLERLAVAADLKDEASGEHGYRVGKWAGLMAQELHWSPDRCFAIDLAARLHDVGKIGVPDRILLNSQELKNAERHFINTHTTIGAELLAKSNVPHLRIAEEIARFHHEWWNGEGYPSNLARTRIPIHARIIALADVFDALTHGRPFAAPWSVERALAEIRLRRGTQFDPELTDLFLKLVERVGSQHPDLDRYLAAASATSPFLQARQKIHRVLAGERENERRAKVASSETGQ